MPQFAADATATARNSSKRAYCTIFDHRYMPRGLALITSLRRHGDESEFFVLCANEECALAMEKLNLPGVWLVTLKMLERAIPRLLEVRDTRTLLEYYYTCAPAITEYVMDAAPDAKSVAYLDADLWFFASPELVFAEIGDAPVAIIPHNFVESRKSFERFGIYNVGWVSFSRSEESLKCLRWWRDSCLDWCYGRIEGDKYADQGYLNHFVSMAPNTKVLHHKGFNTAPWNIGNYRVEKHGGQVFMSGDPLVFFHFHGVDRDFGIFYFDSHRHHRAPHSRIIRNEIYRPYIAELIRFEEVAREIVPQAGVGRAKLRGNSVFGIDAKNLARRALRVSSEIMDILMGRPILVVNDRAY